MGRSFVCYVILSCITWHYITCICATQHLEYSITVFSPYDDAQSAVAYRHIHIRIHSKASETSVGILFYAPIFNPQLSTRSKISEFKKTIKFFFLFSPSSFFIFIFTPHLYLLTKSQPQNLKFRKKSSYSHCPTSQFPSHFTEKSSSPRLPSYQTPNHRYQEIEITVTHLALVVASILVHWVELGVRGCSLVFIRLWSEWGDWTVRDLRWLRMFLLGIWFEVGFWVIRNSEVVFVRVDRGFSFRVCVSWFLISSHFWS